MNSVQLFRLLQTHAAAVNELASKLYNGDMEKDEAARLAALQIEKTREALIDGQILQQ
jgi:hypothetical protein